MIHLAWLSVLCFAVVTDEIPSEFIGKGATAKAGGYRPIQAVMSDSSDQVLKTPDGIEAAKYGKLVLGDRSWLFLLAEPEDLPAELFVDTNGDGDLTNDPETTWTASTNNGMTMYRGEAQVDLGDGRLGSLGLYRFDPKDERRAQLKNTLLYYTDFGYSLMLKIDGEEFESFVSGEPTDKTSLWLDRDHNSVRSYKRETVQIGKPFNFTGTTYEVGLADGKLHLKKSDQTVEMTPLPPDLKVGNPAVAFDAKTMDGNEIHFPKSYAGKIVLLDFWATWCGPCIAELPNVKQAYADWHEEGFEILGVSFDNEDMEEKLVEFMKEKEMPWPQIYEGKGWETSLGDLYDVSGIPFVLLVDGNSGEILATESQLRGPGLTEFIGKVLESKKD